MKPDLENEDIDKSGHQNASIKRLETKLITWEYEMNLFRNVFNYMQLFFLVRRVKRNKENDLLIFQYSIRFVSSAAITIATAVYLWGYEKDTICRAPKTPSSWTTSEELVDVSKQFRDILKIWWTFALVDTARCMLVFASIG